MTPEQHIAALQHVVVQTARFGGPEARAVIGMAVIGGSLPDDMTIGEFFGPEWPPMVDDPEEVRVAAVGVVLNRSAWRKSEE